MIKPFAGSLLTGAIAIALLGTSEPPETPPETTTVRVALSPPQTTTTTTTTTMPSTTTTTTTTPIAEKTQQVRLETYQHPEWIALAQDVGWPDTELARLDHVIHRESRGQPEVWNRDDPMSGSRGLVQVNGFWCKRTTHNTHDAGFLGNLGVLASCEDLFDPRTNLEAALAIYEYGVDRHRCGWGPWQTRGFRPCKK